MSPALVEKLRAEISAEDLRFVVGYDAPPPTRLATRHILPLLAMRRTKNGSGLGGPAQALRA